MRVSRHITRRKKRRRRERLRCADLAGGWAQTAAVRKDMAAGGGVVRHTYSYMPKVRTHPTRPALTAPRFPAELLQHRTPLLTTLLCVVSTQVGKTTMAGNRSARLSPMMPSPPFYPNLIPYCVAGDLIRKDHIVSSGAHRFRFVARSLPPWGFVVPELFLAGDFVFMVSATDVAWLHRCAQLKVFLCSQPQPTTAPHGLTPLTRYHTSLTTQHTTPYHST